MTPKSHDTSSMMLTESLCYEAKTTLRPNGYIIILSRRRFNLLTLMPLGPLTPTDPREPGGP